MNIEELTLKQIREISSLFPSPATDHPYQIGKPYLIRTATMIDVGIVSRVTSREIVLTEASWIPDTGRFSPSLESVDFAEQEPFPMGETIVGRFAVIDACVLPKLPTRKMK